MKTTLTDELPWDVQAFAEKDKEFPTNSTMLQVFDSRALPRPTVPSASTRRPAHSSASTSTRAGATSPSAPRSEVGGHPYRRSRRTARLPAGTSRSRRALPDHGHHPRASERAGSYGARPWTTTSSPATRPACAAANRPGCASPAPARRASSALAQRFPGVARAVETEEYAPKMNVTAERRGPQGRLTRRRGRAPGSR